MKRILFIASILCAVSVSCGRGSSKKASNSISSFTRTKTVYICSSSRSYAYHLYEDCYALGRCSGDIIELSEDEAIDNGRTLCKICQKR